MAQLVYNYDSPIGVAGGIVDIAPYTIDTFLNEENTGTMKFGYGVVRGTTAGKDVKLPTAVTNVFEGVTVNNRTTEYSLEGNIDIKNKAAIGVMKNGRIYVAVCSNLSISYGDKVYLVCTGNDRGKFSNAATGNLEIDATFVKAQGNIASIDLHKCGATSTVEPENGNDAN